MITDSKIFHEFIDLYTQLKEPDLIQSFGTYEEPESLSKYIKEEFLPKFIPIASVGL